MTAPSRTSRKAKWNLVLPGGLLGGAIIAVGVFARGVATRIWQTEPRGTFGLAVEPSLGFLVSWLVASFLAGITVVWLYAAFRLRYGRGPKSAVRAGFVFWFITTLVSAARPSTELISLSLFVGAIVTDLIIVVTAALAGTWLYLRLGGESERFTWRD